jgi:heme-degrading monooxygenase HmoA
MPEEQNHIGGRGEDLEGRAMAPSTKTGDATPLGSAQAGAGSLSGIPTRLIARIWRGQTLAAKADDYTTYLYEAGVRKIAGIPGNRGVQMLRSVRDDTADFQVLSYWDSFEAIKLFAGNDYEKVRHLPDDPEYMIGDEPTVQHFEVVVNDWSQQ